MKMNTAFIEKQLLKGLQGQRTETTALFLKLVAHHLVRESDLEADAGFTIKDDILLRADSEIAEAVRAQIKEGYVVEDNAILCTTGRGSLIGIPVQHPDGKTKERSIFLCAIFEAGAKIPKVGRIRAGFDEKGHITGRHAFQL